jgi:hypothetical protein
MLHGGSPLAGTVWQDADRSEAAAFVGSDAASEREGSGGWKYLTAATGETPADFSPCFILVGIED